jgi:hypothetical protein
MYEPPVARSAIAFVPVPKKRRPMLAALYASVSFRLSRTLALYWAAVKVWFKVAVMGAVQAIANS